MTKNEFIGFVGTQEYLGPQRKKDLIENAGWMTAEERSLLANQIMETGKTLEQNNQSMLDKLQEVESAVQAFKHEELPKLMKTQEQGEHTQEEKEAEKLLQNL
jgi:hypothetical protein